MTKEQKIDCIINDINLLKIYKEDLIAAIDKDIEDLKKLLKKLEESEGEKDEH